MKTLALCSYSILLLLFAVSMNGQQSKVATYTIHGPTVIAYSYVEPQPATTTPADAEDAEFDEGQDDFAFYYYRMEMPLKRAKIRLIAEDSKSFIIKNGSKTQTFKMGKILCGYYLVAPGKAPKVIHGVMTDEDMYTEIRKYFGIRIKIENRD